MSELTLSLFWEKFRKYLEQQHTQEQGHVALWEHWGSSQTFQDILETFYQMLFTIYPPQLQSSETLPSLNINFRFSFISMFAEGSNYEFPECL